MEKDDFIFFLGTTMEGIIKTRKKFVHRVNEKQMKIYKRVVEYMEELAIENDGYLEPINNVVELGSGGATAVFPTLIFSGAESIKKLAEMLDGVTALSIDYCGEKVCVSITVPSVYYCTGKRKK